jgi:hypothetical protein
MGRKEMTLWKKGNMYTNRRKGIKLRKIGHGMERNDNVKIGNMYTNRRK